jgi:hypothetical protein
MRTFIAALAVAAASGSLSPRAEAQILVRHGIPARTRVFVGPGGYPGGYVTPYYGGGYTAPYPGYYWPPYSYYAAPYPTLAREYVGYSQNDFPFYGRPYGHPYDPWTWPYLSGWSFRRDPILW